MSDLPETKVIRVRPGDVIVARTDTAASSFEAAAIRERLQRVWPDNEVLVTHGIDIEVQRPVGAA